MRKIFFIFPLLYFGFTPVVFAQSAVELQALVAQLQERVKSLELQVLSLQSQLKTTQEELGLVKTELKITRTLAKGTTGDEVRQFQEFLRQFPDIYPEGLVTGYFGSLTEAATKRFQEKQGIESVGIVGPKTRAKLNELVVGGASASGVVSPGLTTALDLQRVITPTPSGTIPATPAIPAVHSSGGGGSATPAIPAVPATPAAVVDVVPPIISNIQATSTGSATALITWDTDEPANSRAFVIHGIPTSTNVYATGTPIAVFPTSTTHSDSAYVTNHAMNIDLFVIGTTTISFVVESADSSGNTASSSEYVVFLDLGSKALGEILNSVDFTNVISNLTNDIVALQQGGDFWSGSTVHDIIPWGRTVKTIFPEYNKPARATSTSVSWQDAGLPEILSVQVSVSPSGAGCYRIVYRTQNMGWLFEKIVSGGASGCSDKSTNWESILDDNLLWLWYDKLSYRPDLQTW